VHSLFFFSLLNECAQQQQKQRDVIASKKPLEKQVRRHRKIGKNVQP